jgi:PAP2 superfamily
MRRGGFLALAMVVAAWTGAVTPTADASPVRSDDGTGGGDETDAVIAWNQHATDALIGVAAQPPSVAVLHMAMVQGAVYDAVNAIDRGFKPYLVAPRAKRWYSTDAAAATAAHRVLSSLVPGQQVQLDAWYRESLDAIPDGRAEDGGVGVGDEAAAAMLAARADDGRFGSFRFPVGTEPGEWRPVLPAFVNDPNAWVARVTPFLIDSPERFRSRGPNPLTSRRYAKEFAEVKAIGSLTSTTRSADQTDAAQFWAENAVGMWNRIARQLAGDRHLGNADAARLFARLDLTGADAVISCWDDKAHWGFWRPITAIREADTDNNPATVPDPGWLPLLTTPPYPDHPSGHNCLSSSIVFTLRSYFGTDRTTFSATSATSGTTRTFTRFTQAREEIINARVWSGIHFRTADDQGATIGKEVAHFSRTHFFQRAH